MPRWTVVVFVVALASAIALPAAAQWKWRDKNGQTQYSDLPPPLGVADKDILLRPNAAASVPPAPAASAGSAAAATLAAKGVDSELEAKRKLATQAEADRRKADDARLAAVRADNCVHARDQMRTLDSGLRVARVNARGEREMLDDTARAEETRRAREAIAADCR